MNSEPCTVLLYIVEGAKQLFAAVCCCLLHVFVYSRVCAEGLGSLGLLSAGL